jgi:Bacterial SH3 domain
MALRPMVPVLLFPVVALALGCAKADTLTVKPGTPTALELLPSPRLEEFAYKKILLLPFEGEVTLEDTELPVLRQQDGSYYTNRLEKALLARGFEVISPEIVARVSKSVKDTGKLSAVEKAMVMGKETKADAVFVVQSIVVVGIADFYAVDKLETVKLDPGKVEEKKGQFYQPETKDCVYQLPYYAVQLEGKLIDATTGSVLWVGSGRQTVIDSLTESYVAKLGKKECELLEENFVFADKLAGEPQLSAVVTDLAGRLLDPLKTLAQKGKPLPVDKPKAEKPKVEPPPPPQPAGKTAVVSQKKASLRAGPGNKNDRLRYVTRKTKVEVLETMGEWSKVQLQDGAVGWMHESTIIVEE